MTLAVRLGRERARRLYAVARRSAPTSCSAIGLLAAGGPGWATLPYLSLAARRGPDELVCEHTDGPSLNKALAQTGALLGAFSVLLSAGLLIATPDAMRIRRSR